MGYNTDFKGSIAIDPPLNTEEIEFLTHFSESRRVARLSGPYTVTGEGVDDDVINYNTPPPGQPGLWCDWVPTSNGMFLRWNNNEKSYDNEHWIAYLIEHFLKPGCRAKEKLPFLQANHVLNGIVEARGEDFDDRWFIRVHNNVVAVATATLAPGTFVPVNA